MQRQYGSVTHPLSAGISVEEDMKGKEGGKTDEQEQLDFVINLQYVIISHQS